MNYLLDTCVLSEYVKKQPQQKVLEWLDEQDEESLFISVLSIGEIEKGIVKQKLLNPSRGQKLAIWLEKVEQRFAKRILSIYINIMREWGALCIQSESHGIKLPVIDSLLIATARCYQLTVVTRNIHDFDKFSKVYNSWEE